MIFFLCHLRFGVGKHKFPVLGYAAEFLSLIGTDNHSFEEFNKELQKIGSSFNVSSSRDYFRIYIDGLEENFEETIGLINELLTQMKPDDSQLEKFYDEAKTERKVEIKDPYTIGYALRSYSLYMDSSYYLSRLSLDEIKKINSDTLIKSIKEALKWEVDIFYCGKKDLGEVSNLLNDNFQFPDNPVKSTSPVSLNRDVPRENLVYLLNDKKVIQSQVYIIMEGETNDEHGIAIAKAFNEYFGGSMNSIIFQEIREFRSFAYSAWGYYYVPFRKNERGYF